MEKTGLTFREVVELFKYRKNNEGYWDGFKLHKQVVIKTLPIAEALYPGYLFLFCLTILQVILVMQIMHFAQQE